MRAAGNAFSIASTCVCRIKYVRIKWCERPCACIELYGVSPRMQSYIISLYDYVKKNNLSLCVCARVRVLRVCVCTYKYTYAVWVCLCALARFGGRIFIRVCVYGCACACKLWTTFDVLTQYFKWIKIVSHLKRGLWRPLSRHLCTHTHAHTHKYKRIAHTQIYTRTHTHVCTRTHVHTLWVLLHYDCHYSPSSFLHVMNAQTHTHTRTHTHMHTCTLVQSPTSGLRASCSCCSSL